MRIVLDTNVWISALFWRGPAHRLLCAAEAGRFSLAASRETLAELERVLARPKFRAPLALRGRTVEEVLIFALGMVDLVEPAPIPFREVPELRDPDDLMFLSLASSAGASILVSGDLHLLGMGVWRGVRILGPAGAAQILKVR